jgi:hypothetical protein
LGRASAFPDPIPHHSKFVPWKVRKIIFVKKAITKQKQHEWKVFFIIEKKTYS